MDGETGETSPASEVTAYVRARILFPVRAGCCRNRSSHVSWVCSRVGFDQSQPCLPSRHASEQAADRAGANRPVRVVKITGQGPHLAQGRHDYRAHGHECACCFPILGLRRQVDLTLRVKAIEDADCPPRRQLRNAGPCFHRRRRIKQAQGRRTHGIWSRPIVRPRSGGQTRVLAPEQKRPGIRKPCTLCDVNGREGIWHLPCVACKRNDSPAALGKLTKSRVGAMSPQGRGDSPPHLQLAIICTEHFIHEYDAVWLVSRHAE
ncbi:MAG: hypothetical protein QOH75_1347 [Actinomycetota bacterium]|jgi:hypothetical protein|nr:hypothetical protein [Actinomycetota bacterium]